MPEKEIALKTIRALPDDCSLEEIAERVEFMAAVILQPRLQEALRLAASARYRKPAQPTGRLISDQRRAELSTTIANFESGGRMFAVPLAQAGSDGLICAEIKKCSDACF